MERGKRKILVGMVLKDKMEKTRVVEVVRAFRHPFYDKIVRKRKKYYMHDEKNESRMGDKVKIMETRPLSKLKRWRLIEVVGKTV